MKVKTCPQGQNTTEGEDVICL